MNINEIVNQYDPRDGDWREFFKNSVRSYLIDNDESGAFEFALRLQKEFEAGGHVSQAAMATPQVVARQMCRVGGVEKGALALDPCAGFGSLLHAAKDAGANVYGYESNGHMAFIATLIGDYHIRQANFFRYPPPDRFNLDPDVVLLHPPGGDATSGILRRIHRLFRRADPRIVVLLPVGYFSKRALKRTGGAVNKLFNVEDIVYLKRWRQATLGNQEVAIYLLSCQG